MKTQWATAGTDGMGCSTPVRSPADTQTFDCIASVGNPLVALSPYIDWSLDFKLVWGASHVHYTVNGCHDGFPAYAGYINGTALYQHDDNGDPSSLFGSCDTPVEAEGDVQ